MKRILVLDNYDSFTWNLVQLIETLGAEVAVVRNDSESAADLVRRRPDGVVLSPGPGVPERAGATLDAVAGFARDAVPVLGVCLGHQAIGVAFGARVRRARAPRHGKSVAVAHDGAGVFTGLRSPLEVALYHSLVLDEFEWPVDLVACARSPEGEVMALRHRSLPLHGVQFHPESVLTDDGASLLRNFLAGCGARAAA